MRQQEGDAERTAREAAHEAKMAAHIERLNALHAEGEQQRLAEREAKQAAGPADKGRGLEGEREGTSWTDEEGEAGEKEMAAMIADYQRDPAAVEATWDASGGQDDSDIEEVMGEQELYADEWGEDALLERDMNDLFVAERLEDNKLVFEGGWEQRGRRRRSYNRDNNSD